MPINQMGPRPAGIDGILKALQTVHAVYGINTEAAQKKLLDTQVEKAQRENEAEKSYNETGKLNPTQALKLGYVIQPGESPAAGAPAPAGAPTSPDAGAPTPLQGLAAPQAQPPQSGTPLQGLSKKQYGMAPITLGNGQTVSGRSLKIAKEEADLAHTEQQMGLAESEETRKQRGEISGIQNEFNQTPGVKESLADLDAAKGVSKLLLSGNKLGTQGAQKRLGLLMLGVSRLGPEVSGTAEAQDAISRVKNALSMGASGFSTPEEVAAAHKVAEMVYQNAAGAVDTAATRYAAQKAPLFKQHPDEFKQKNLLPTGFGEAPPETRVLPNKKTGKPTVYYLDRTHNAFLPVRNQE